MADGTIKYQVEIDNKGAIKGIDQITDEADDASKKLDGKASSIISTVGKVAATVAATATAALVGITKQAISAFGEFEQLAGGVEKIFGDAMNAQIMKDAADAYMDLNMSANQYLSTINDVGATFASTMGSQKGYDTARQGLKAIADYASGTGKSVDLLSEKFTMITRATSTYQSIADQFSGILPATSAAFLEQAQAAGFLSTEYQNLTDVPIDEYQQAVAEMLTLGVDKLNLLGNTAAETANTLTGSIAGTKAAYQNFIAGLADDTADIETLTTRLVEMVGVSGEMIIERIGVVLNTLVSALPNLINQILPPILTAIQDMLPTLLTAVVALVDSVINTLIQSLSTLMPMLVEMTPQLIQSAIDMFMGLLSGLEQVVPVILQYLPALVVSIVTTLLDNLPVLVMGAVNLFTGLITGLLEMVPQLIAELPKLITQLCETLIMNTPLLIAAAIQLFFGLVTGLISAGVSLLSELWQLILQLPQTVKGFVGDMIQAGGDLLQGLIDGIKAKVQHVIETVKNAVKNAVDAAKDFLGIHSPSTVFKAIGSFTMEGLAEGIEGAKSQVNAVMGDVVSDIVAKGSTIININGLEYTNNANVASAVNGLYNSLQLDLRMGVI